MPYSPTLGTRPEDLQPNHISPAGAVTSQQENFYDRPIPEQATVYARHAEYVGWATMLRMMGTVNGFSNPTTGHYEEPYKEDALLIGSVVTPAGGAGNNLVAALDATQMYNTSVTAGGAGRQASFILPKDVVEFDDGNQARVESKDVTVNPHRITLKPLDATVDLDSSVATATPYHIAYNSFGEGTGAPGVRQPRFIKYTNTPGIVKSAWGITGSERTSVIFPEVLPGKQSSIYWRLSVDALYFHDKALDGMLLFGQQADNIVDLDTDGLSIDVDVVGTEGYIPFVKTGGTIVNPTAGAYTTDDIDAIVNVLEDERATSSNAVCGIGGSLIQQERENALQELFSDNLAPFINRMFMNYQTEFDFNQIARIDGEYDSSYSFGIHHVRKSQIDFFFKKMPIFNDIKRAGIKNSGTPVYEYPNTTIYQPLGQRVKTSTGSMAPVVGYEYKELEGLSRHMVVNQIPGPGTMNGVVSSDKDYMLEIITSEVAAHYCCANATVYETLV